MTVTKLIELREIYKKDKDKEKLIESILSFFKETGEYRFDVARVVFEDFPELKKPLIKAKWKPIIKKYTKLEISYINLSIFTDLLLDLSKRDDYYITLTKEIFGEKDFRRLEDILLKSAEEHIHEMLDDEVDFMSKEKMQKDTIDFLKEEYTGTYYEKEIEKIIENFMNK